MKQFFKTVIYLILLLIILWYSFFLFSLILAFSYSDHILSWIPYIILGCWAPGKLYGLTLIHVIICVAICFAVVDFFNKKINIKKKAKFIILIMITILFVNEGFLNFFFPNGLDTENSQLRQVALIQFSFVIGLLIKAFNPTAEMN
jgi:hypothetical protein